jgi:hypothetical protein
MLRWIAESQIPEFIFAEKYCYNFAEKYCQNFAENLAIVIGYLRFNVHM